MTTIATRLRYDVVLDLFDQALSCQVFEHALSRLITIEADVSLARIGGHSPVLVYHNDLREVVSHAGFEIVEVMRGRYLDCAAAELGLGIVVGDQWNLATRERQYYRFSEQALVPVVRRVGSDSRIAENRLGPRCRNRDKPGTIFKRIADMEK